MYEEKIKCMNSGKNEQLGKKEKKIMICHLTLMSVYLFCQGCTL